MCGRFSQRTPAERLRREFGLREVPGAGARFNVAPSQNVLAVRRSAGGREAVRLKWGLIPPWAKDGSAGARLINARAETVAEKPAFRGAFQRRRALIPADGFYEWGVASTGGRKQPYYFRMKDGRPFAFAGLWERWSGAAGEEVETCAILTTRANEVVGPVHERMPVILRAEAYDLWLDESVRGGTSLTNLLVPYRADEMTAYPVGLRVNSPAHDDERCLAPAP